MEPITDQEGSKLYGFSVRDMNRNTTALWMIATILFLWLVFALGVLLFVDRHNILSNIVMRCVC